MSEGAFRAGEAAAIATAITWSFTALLFAAAARRLGAGQANLIRLALATLLLGALVLGTGAASRPPGGQVALLLLSGVIGLALGDAAWFRALRILGGRRASLFSPLWPAFAALLALPLLGEGIGWVDGLGMAAALGGVLWSQSEADGGGEVQGSLPLGLACGVLACLGQAAGYVVAKAGLGAAPAGTPLADWAGLAARGGAAGEEVSPLFGTLLRMAGGTAWILASAVVRREVGAAREALRDRRGMALLAGGTVLGPVLGVWLSLVALAYARSTAVASTLLATSPLFVIPVARVVHGTPITLRAVLGAAVAIGGVALLTLG